LNEAAINVGWGWVGVTKKEEDSFDVGAVTVTAMWLLYCTVQHLSETPAAPHAPLPNREQGFINIELNALLFSTLLLFTYIFKMQ
jgi:hypothetical protein